jgi:hypothetical protein
MGQRGVVKPPVIIKTRPANGAHTEALPERILEIRFDRAMHHDMLAAPDRWLGVWFVRRGDAIAEDIPYTSLVVRMQLEYNDLPGGGPASEVSYRLKKGWEHAFPDGLYKKDIRVLVVAFARSNSIVSDGDNVLLDAEFKGTQLDFDQKGLFLRDLNLTLTEALRNMNPGDQGIFSKALFDGLSSTGTPPDIPPAGTGDGNPGGLFQSFFILKKG